MLTDFNWPLIAMTLDGRTACITRYYRQGPFALHRAVRHRGWTITHWATGDSIIERLPTLRVARLVAEELIRLSPKWKQLKGRHQLWLLFQQRMNVREQYAISCYIVALRKQWNAL